MWIRQPRFESRQRTTYNSAISMAVNMSSTQYKDSSNAEGTKPASMAAHLSSTRGAWHSVVQGVPPW